jgi:hypothetical protein
MSARHSLKGYEMLGRLTPCPNLRRDLKLIFAFVVGFALLFAAGWYLSASLPYSGRRRFYHSSGTSVFSLVGIQFHEGGLTEGPRMFR